MVVYLFPEPIALQNVHNKVVGLSTVPKKLPGRVNIRGYKPRVVKVLKFIVWLVRTVPYHGIDMIIHQTLAYANVEVPRRIASTI